MFWKTVFAIIALAVFIFLGGGRWVVKVGNGVVDVGHGMESLEKTAKYWAVNFLDYIKAYGEKKVEKAIKERRRLEEEPGGK